MKGLYDILNGIKYRYLIDRLNPINHNSYGLVLLVEPCSIRYYHSLWVVFIY